MDSQKKEYLDFLLSDPADREVSCPLPLGANDDNLDRVDPEEPITQTGIYRDRWERAPLPDDGPDARLKDAIYHLDYPTVTDWAKSNSRAKVRRDGFVDSDEDMDDNYEANH